VPKILIVDDSPAIRSFIRVYLSWQSCELLEADNGDRALQIARLVPIDLVIADVNMPGGIDGIGFVRALRARPELKIKEIPVILLTADKSADVESRAMQAGANRFLRKPINPEMLGEMVRELLAPVRRHSTRPRFDPRP